MIRYFTALLLLVCLFTACSDGDLIKIEGVEEELTTSCIAFSDNSYVVEDEAGLSAIQNSEGLMTECLDLVFPEIDFEQRTLVGRLIRTNFCNPSHQFEVWANTESEVYEVHITTEGNSTCDVAHTSYLWLSFGKLPESYDIQFHLSE